MKPQDLRIGNFLIDSLTWSVLKVSDISETGFTTTVIDRSKFPLPDGWIAKPIPLTEEWFLKCGYEKSNYPNFKLKVGALTLISRLSTAVCYSEFAGVYLGCRIKYVHELQNFYHAMLGNDLKINLLDDASGVGPAASRSAPE